MTGKAKDSDARRSGVIRGPQDSVSVECPKFAAAPLLGGLNPREFLARYWQKEPFLVRSALPDSIPLLTADELAGLACEDGIESRLVLEGGKNTRWEVRHGPFDAELFTQLPDTHWTLLVQDVDKLLPNCACFLEQFRFVPDWRIDDLMVSYAVRGGSVGPHVDDYDVFLFQAIGSRRWLVGGDAGAEENQRVDAELRIMQAFEPEHDWTLDAGDLLYLPPGVPHHGIAESDDCMTYSIGFRAPSWQDVMTMVFDQLVDQVGPRERYADPDLKPQENPAQLSGRTVTAFRRGIETLMRFDEQAFVHWLGSWLTEPKELSNPTGPAHTIDAEALAERLRSGMVLSWDSAARLLFFDESGYALTMFVSGEAIEPPPCCEGLVRELARNRRVGATALDDAADETVAAIFLADLFNRGYLILIVNED